MKTNEPLTNAKLRVTQLERELTMHKESIQAAEHEKQDAQRALEACYTALGHARKERERIEREPADRKALAEYAVNLQGLIDKEPLSSFTAMKAQELLDRITENPDVFTVDEALKQVKSAVLTFRRDVQLTDPTYSWQGLHRPVKRPKRKS